MACCHQPSQAGSVIKVSYSPAAISTALVKLWISEMWYVRCCGTIGSQWMNGFGVKPGVWGLGVTLASYCHTMKTTRYRERGCFVHVFGSGLHNPLVVWQHKTASKYKKGWRCTNKGSVTQYCSSLWHQFIITGLLNDEICNRQSTTVHGQYAYPDGLILWKRMVNFKVWFRVGLRSWFGLVFHIVHLSTIQRCIVVTY